MATLRVTLTFPADLVRQPLVYTVAKNHRLVPNIRKARVTESQGETTLDLTGTEYPPCRLLRPFPGIGAILLSG